MSSVSTAVCLSPPSAARSRAAERCAAADTDAGSMAMSSDRTSSPSSPTSARERGAPTVEDELMHVDARDSDWFRQAERDCDAFLARLARTEEELAEEEEEGGEAGEDGGDHEEWVPSRVLARKQCDGEPWLKVAWRWHAEPTWVLEEDFVDDGHQPLLDAFRRRQRPKSTCARRTREERRPPEPPFLDPERYWPNFRTHMADLFMESGLSLVKVENIMDEGRSRQFLETLLQARAKGCNLVPAMLTHGTSLCSIDGIIKHGLCMPGTCGVTIRNGSVHGVGIYTARTPRSSLGYVRGCNLMFVCAGLVDGEFESSTKQPGDIVVFFEPSYVLPLFLVEYTFSGGTSKPEYQYHPRGQPPYAVPYRRFVRATIPQPRPPLPPPAPTTVRGQVAQNIAPNPDAVQRHLQADKTHKKLSKRDIKGMPSWAKQAYRQGMLGQKSGKK